MIQSIIRQLFSTQLRLNILSGSFSTVLGFIVSAVKFPLYIHFLGYEHYGVWLLLSTILAFAQMGLLGTDTALVKLVAEEYAQENHKAIQEYFMTASCMLLVIGGVLLGTSILFKSQIILFMGLEGENSQLASNILIYMVFFSTGVLAYQIINSILAGIGRFDLANYSQTALQFIPLPISVPLFLLGQGVLSVLIANVVAYLLVYYYNFTKVNETVTLNLFNITSCSLKRFKKMITFGSKVFAGFMLTLIIQPIVKIVITKSIGVEGVPVFELAYRVSMQMRSFFQVAFRALMPEFSTLSSCQSQHNTARLKKIISKSYRLLFVGATPLYILVYILAEIIFKLWLRQSYIPTIPIVFRALLFTSFVSLIGVIPYYLNLGQGKVNKILIHHILTTCGTLISLGLVMNFVPNFKTVTIAWCFLPGAILGTGYLLFYLARNRSSAFQP